MYGSIWMACCSIIYSSTGPTEPAQLMRQELGARGGRQYFKSLLESTGVDGLTKQILTSLSCPSNRTQAGQRVIRGRATKYEPECAARRGLSDEEERLLEIYRKRGIEPLVEELKKF
jgi:hypothetical protein